MKKPCYFGRFNSLGHTAEACQKLWKALTIGVLVLLFGGCWLARLAANTSLTCACPTHCVSLPPLFCFSPQESLRLRCRQHVPLAWTSSKPFAPNKCALWYGPVAPAAREAGLHNHAIAADRSQSRSGV
jgi:hypothetical protein